ncbi:MAG: copper-binding protein [Candidatus Binatia bacterium]
MTEWISKAGALFSSIFASISCFAPLLAASSGNAALGALAGLAIYRPYFIGLAGLALIYSFFTTFLEKFRRGTLHPKNYSFGKEEIILSATTLLVFLAIFFPYIKGVCPAQSGLSYEGKGLIIQVDRAEGKITLDHKEIKGLVPAMSMEYAVDSPGLLRGFKSGDLVRFKLSSRGIEFVVVEIAKKKNP